MRIGSAAGAQGSTAMFVSRGLGGPKAVPNRTRPKGKPVNIPAPSRMPRPAGDASGWAEYPRQGIEVPKSGESRNAENRMKVPRPPSGGFG